MTRYAKYAGLGRADAAERKRRAGKWIELTGWTSGSIVGTIKAGGSHMAKTLAKPTVHLNGTSRDSLQEQIEEAAGAVRAALEALGQAAPHARDYYVQGNGEPYPSTFRQAVEQHNDRCQRLKSVLDELSELYESVLGD